MLQGDKLNTLTQIMFLLQPCHRVQLAAQVEASCMDDDFGEGARAAASKPRRRQYRVKSDLA